ncbi:MAG: DUF1631 domain-containing protein [Comamonadaceae bacterium]|nr:MAG: DUF1631 domain-containing protein [Comamonadaceae bacterium]
MASALPKNNNQHIGRQARERFVGDLARVMPELAQQVLAKLQTLFESSSSGRDLQDRRDAIQLYQKGQKAWAEGTMRAWSRALQPPTATTRVRLESAAFELIGDDVVENKILSSRMALAIAEKVVDLNDLRLRIQGLENTSELVAHDILRPEVVTQLLVEQWTAAGFTRELWAMAHEIVQQQLVERCIEAYRHTNDFLIERGVMPEIDLKGLVRRTASGAPGQQPRPGPPSTGGGGPEQLRQAGGGGPGGSRGSHGGAYTGAGDASPSGRTGPGSRLGPNEETRMMTSGTPLARARQRAQGVLGQLKRMLTDRGAEFDQETHTGKASPALAEAISMIDATQIHSGGGTVQQNMSGMAFEGVGVEQASTVVRQRTAELKKKASTTAEKATIEIVALMFQSILAEERIPPSVRVWFARLQMPVLRVALSEPEFFGTLMHPARQLIDRMGSCVMGFDASAINGSALELEIKRVVQVIEQYPETGRRVFQLVYEEFQKFLSKFLTESGANQRLVTVAQQVEQKETLAIQYTIEMRNMLRDIPVRDEIREFLFKVWAEVLAIAAVQKGPQHEDTIALKKSASDLVWAASAKPNRLDRARVIQDLPALLQRLRQGMTLLGVQGPAQEIHIKTIGDTLADAFLSKTQAIPRDQIDAMAKRLANLEDFVGDGQSGDLPLDTESIEMMLGIDASAIVVVADGGSQPSDAMLAWANELQLGTWFTLDHNNKMSQVQFAWRSDRKQLHLFASTDGTSFLIQARRLAAYLQAGLLLPAEEEALTVRATRDALAKLDANPERLLN